MLGGKSHLGDLDQFLPCVHGFDEYFGYLYHLDAMKDPSHPNDPYSRKDTVSPRNRVRRSTTSADDPTVQPR
jgi:arylsulfatase A-like enzyme